MEKQTTDDEVKLFLEKMNMKQSWAEVVLEEFIQLAEIEVNEELKLTPLKRAFERITVLTGKSEDELYDLTQSDFGHLITASQFCDTEPETLFKESATFMIGENEYGYRKPTALTAGEQISLEVGLAMAKKYKRSALPEILAVLIRPVIRKSDAEFGEVVDIEPFDTKKFPLRVAKFKKELRVPFFIHALSRITTGVNGIKSVSQSFMSKDSTTNQGKSSKKK